MKEVIGSTILLIAVMVILVLPWYPVTTSQVVPQTSASYTVEFEVPTTGSQMETVYTLTNRVVTEYSQTTVPPYTILGVLASALILVLLALLLVLSILFDRGIITVSTNRRKKRKRR